MPIFFRSKCHIFLVQIESLRGDCDGGGGGLAALQTVQVYVRERDRHISLQSHSFFCNVWQTMGAGSHREVKKKDVWTKCWVVCFGRRFFLNIVVVVVLCTLIFYLRQMTRFWLVDHNLVVFDVGQEDVFSEG